MTVSVSDPSPDSGTGRFSADDAVGDGAAQTQRRTGGDHFLADPQLAGVAELGHREVVDIVHLEHGQIGLGIAPDGLARHLGTVVEHHRHFELARTGGRLRDDVVVGDDVPATVDDHPGSLRPSSSLLASMVTTESATEAATFAIRPSGTSPLSLVDKVTLEVVKAPPPRRWYVRPSRRRVDQQREDAQDGQRRVETLPPKSTSRTPSFPGGGPMTTGAARSSAGTPTRRRRTGRAKVVRIPRALSLTVRRTGVGGMTLQRLSTGKRSAESLLEHRVGRLLGGVKVSEPR